MVAPKYYPLQMSNNTSSNIGLVMMVKDEEQRITVTLDSIKNIIHTVFIYDTGSTDNTVEVIRTYCEKNNMPLYLWEGEFEDFATSRNFILETVDNMVLLEQLNIQFLLLLDGNDEVVRSDKLLEFCKTWKPNETNISSWHLQLSWKVSEKHTTNLSSNRLIRPLRGWRYVGVVHEYLTNSKGDTSTTVLTDPLNQVVIFQEREFDCLKSAKRYHRDKEMLLNAYWKEPQNERTVFYLANTLFNLCEFREALRFYEMRTEMKPYFKEEIYEAFYRIGEIEMMFQNYAVAITAFLKAFEMFPRIEALVEIGKHYDSKKAYALAYTFFSTACDLELPSNSILFVKEHMYTYDRYHYLGRVAFYVGQKHKGKWACEKAISARGLQIDKDNLQFYIE
jgi:tetratricopeptide (TPR) repeat protein